MSKRVTAQSIYGAHPVKGDVVIVSELDIGSGTVGLLAGKDSIPRQSRPSIPPANMPRDNQTAPPPSPKPGKYRAVLGSHG